MTQDNPQPVAADPARSRAPDAPTEVPPADSGRTQDVRQGQVQAETLIDQAPWRGPDAGPPPRPAAPAPASDVLPASAVSYHVQAVSGGPEVGVAVAQRGLPQVAGYELVDVLGRGGMGVVYRARQLSLNRLVALKMLAGGRHAGEQLEGRFRAEADAVARLNHPHIVQIYEVGQSDGQPFFSLEYVAGGSLAEKIDRRPQPVRESAALVATLAEALEHAHRHGIVHRDLKPANVLLAPDGTPKVTDFGLAKLLERDSGYTQTGDVMGTPSYMAPEQASGVTKNIGPACDIYALGVILYELLTGRPPFQGSDPVETLLLVLSEEPIPPRRLVPKLPRDLETICLKCLEKNPRRRYASAGELAADLGRFLCGTPIVARPVSILERAGKWARRRPALAGLVLVIALAAAMLLSGSWWYNARLSAALGQAEASLSDAQDVVDRLLTEVSVERLAPLPQSEQVRRELLAQALHFCQGFLKRNPTDPAVRQQAGRAYRQMGDIQQLLGDFDAAGASYAAATGFLAPSGEGTAALPSAAAELAANLNNQANLNQRQGRLVEAAEGYRAALAALQPHAGAGARYGRQLAACRSNLAVVLAALGDSQSAGREIDAAIAVLEPLAERSEATSEDRAELAAARINQAAIRQDEGAPGAALAALQSAQELLAAFPSDLRRRPEQRYAEAMIANNLGAVHEARQETAAAQECFQRASALVASLVSDFPGHTSFQQGWAEARLNLAESLIGQGRDEPAEPLLVETLEQLKPWREAAPGDPVLCRAEARAAGSLGLVFDRSGRHREGEDLVFRAIELLKPLGTSAHALPASRSELAFAIGRYAQLLAARRQLEPARTGYYQAVDLYEQALAGAATNERIRLMLAQTYNRLGEFLIDLGEPGEAARVAARLESLAHNLPQWRLEAVGLLAACVPLISGVKSDEQSPDPELPLADYCRQQALTVLGELVAGGQVDASALASDPAFESLRELPQFAALLEAARRAPTEQAAQ